MRKDIKDYFPIPLRLALGIIFIAHGLMKLTTGILGFSGILAGLGVPVPTPVAALVTLVEFGGGILLILGLLTRYASIAIAVDMAMAIILVTSKKGLIGGSELEIMLLAAAVSIALSGPGKFSLDHLIKTKS